MDTHLAPSGADYVLRPAEGYMNTPHDPGEPRRNPFWHRPCPYCGCLVFWAPIPGDPPAVALYCATCRKGWTEADPAPETKPPGQD
jgi:hypothetical protein